MVRRYGPRSYKKRRKYSKTIYTYVEEKDYAPVEIIDDDNYVPTGAVLGSGMYGSANSDSSEEEQFCSECGAKNST